MRRLLLVVALLVALIPPVVLGTGIWWVAHHAQDLGQQTQQRLQQSE